MCAISRDFFSTFPCMQWKRIEMHVFNTQCGRCWIVKRKYKKKRTFPFSQRWVTRKVLQKGQKVSLQLLNLNVLLNKLIEKTQIKQTFELSVNWIHSWISFSYIHCGKVRIRFKNQILSIVSIIYVYVCVYYPCVGVIVWNLSDVKSCD